MAKKLTPAQQKRIKKAIYDKADAIGYASSGRIDNGHFMDDLVEDPDIGGILRDYMTKEKVRTYIKDGVLNAYTKALKKKALSAITPASVVKVMYDTEADVIQQCTGKNCGVSVLRAQNGHIFVVSSGTVIKWETALRKAIELIAREKGLSSCGKPEICLQLASLSAVLTESEKCFISTALAFLNVKAYFCGK